MAALLAFCLLSVSLLITSHAALPLPASVERGVVFWGQNLAYTAAYFNQTLDQIQEVGAQSVEIVVEMVQSTLTSSDIKLVGPSTDVWEQLLQAIRERGMNSVVKLFLSPASGAFGSWLNISAADPVSWFGNYTAAATAIASLAEENGATRLVIGMELLTMSRQHEDLWAGMIAQIRKVFFGRLTYGALPISELRSVVFWPYLDEIGVDAYWPLVTNLTVPPLSTLIGTYLGILDGVRSWRQSVGLQNHSVVFPETGFPSSNAALLLPYIYPYQCGGLLNGANNDTQALGLDALFAGIAANHDMIGGLFLFWWDNVDTPDYYPNRGSSSSNWLCSFTPRGKPGYETLVTAYSTE